MMSEADDTSERLTARVGVQARLTAVRLATERGQSLSEYVRELIAKDEATQVDRLAELEARIAALELDAAGDDA